jgi:hypothetical protein
MARSGLALMLYGSPGIGKTAMLQNLGADPRLLAWSNEVSGQALERLAVVTLSAPELNVEDLLGVPTVEELIRTHRDGQIKTHKVTRWALPAALDPSQPFILFIDEPNRCDPGVRNALFQLITGRTTSGGFTLPPGSLACMAGNRLEDRAGVRNLDTAFSNRCGHFELSVDAEAWLDWASLQPGFSSLVRAFISRHPSHLSRFDPAHPAPQQATPRTWAGLGLALHSTPRSLAPSLVHGLVGTECAQLFQAYITHASIVPSLTQLLNNPEAIGIPAPGQLDQAYVFAIGIGDLLHTLNPPPMNHQDPIGQAVGRVLGRLASHGFEEVTMMVLQRAFRQDQKTRIPNTPISPRIMGAVMTLHNHPMIAPFMKDLVSVGSAAGHAF